MSWYRAKYETPRLRWQYRPPLGPWRGVEPYRKEAHCGSAPLCRQGRARARIRAPFVLAAWLPAPHGCSP